MTSQSISQIPSHVDRLLSKTDLQIETLCGPILQSLLRPDTVLAIAAHMEKAVIVDETQEEGAITPQIVDRTLAEVIALKGWVTGEEKGRITRYRLTHKGRNLARKTTSRSSISASGFHEPAAQFQSQKKVQDPMLQRVRYGAIETPLMQLARRKNKQGENFLTDDLLHAGERLHEDFVMSGCHFEDGQNYEMFLTQLLSEESPATARVKSALQGLGPGLGDVVLRCCCNLQGLEQIEKELNWSARSGKVVLRIALMRLASHYKAIGDKAGLMA